MYYIIKCKKYWRSDIMAQFTYRRSDVDGIFCSVWNMDDYICEVRSEGADKLVNLLNNLYDKTQKCADLIRENEHLKQELMLVQNNIQFKE